MRQARHVAPCAHAFTCPRVGMVVCGVLHLRHILLVIHSRREFRLETRNPLWCRKKNSLPPGGTHHELDLAAGRRRAHVAGGEVTHSSLGDDACRLGHAVALEDDAAKADAQELQHFAGDGRAAGGHHAHAAAKALPQLGKDWQGHAGVSRSVSAVGRTAHARAGRVPSLSQNALTGRPSASAFFFDSYAS